MSLYKRAGTPHWWCRFQLDGREVRLSTRTADRRQAEEFETLARARAYRQIRLGERADYPWKDAARRWLAESRQRSKEKDEAIIAWLNQHLADASVQAITREVVEELRALKAEETSEATADRYMALLRAILRKCADDWGVLEKAPKVPMYRPERPEPRWLTPAEFHRLEAELPAHLKVAARFAVLTGLRMRSMLSLTWDQVDLKGRRAWIAAAEMKGKTTHGLPLNPDAMTLLKGLERECEFVFHWRGQRMDDCNGKAFQDAVTRAKVGPLRWHDLRHTWASWAIQGGATLMEVMQLGGWKSLVMVQRYAHLAPDHLAEAAARVRIPVQKPAQRKRPAKRSA